MEAVNVIEAHNSPLSCIALNNDGTLLATASEKGTIIRVFSIPDAQKLYQFRRGSIPARIYSMSFNSTSTLLSVSSATETVHIFRLGGPKTSRSNSVSSGLNRRLSETRERSGSRVSEGDFDDFSASTADVTASATAERRAINPTLASMIRRTSQNVGKSFAATVGGYLPSAVAEMWEPSRDFAWVKIPKSIHASSPVRSVVALSNNGPQIMVVTSEGNYYIFNVDLEKGGEGTLYKQYSYVLVPWSYLYHDLANVPTGCLNLMSSHRAVHKTFRNSAIDCSGILHVVIFGRVFSFLGIGEALDLVPLIPHDCSILKRGSTVSRSTVSMHSSLFCVGVTLNIKVSKKQDGDVIVSIAGGAKRVSGLHRASSMHMRCREGIVPPRVNPAYCSDL